MISTTSKIYFSPSPTKSQVSSIPAKPPNAAATTSIPIPTMSEIMESSKSQNLNLRLQTVGPFFRTTAKNVETDKEIGRAEGMIRPCLGRWKILHLDSIRLSKETMGMDRSIFGIGLFIGAVMVRHGFDSGCRTAELLAINDTPLYHSKLVRFYDRLGFKAVKEVRGGSMEDIGHMLVWGGRGTLMEANVEELLRKWRLRLTPSHVLSSK